MNIFLGFMGVLLVSSLITSLIYAIAKKKLALGISLAIGILIVSGLWWWLSSAPTPNTPSSGSGTWSSSLQSPSLKTVWEGTKNRWLLILPILVIMFFLSFFIPNPWAKALQWLSAMTAFMLFVLFPVLVGIQGDENPNSQSSQGCPLFSSSKVSKCMITKKKVVVTADQLTSAGEFEFCAVVPEGSAFHIVRVRTNTLEMWSSDGEFPAEYKMIKRNDLVNGKCPNRF